MSMFEELCEDIARDRLFCEHYRAIREKIVETNEKAIRLDWGQGSLDEVLDLALYEKEKLALYDVEVKITCTPRYTRYRFKSVNEAEYAFLVLELRPWNALTGEEQREIDEKLAQTKKSPWLFALAAFSPLTAGLRSGIRAAERRLRAS